jgi:hypothetical protein
MRKRHTENRQVNSFQPDLVFTRELGFRLSRCNTLTNPNHLLVSQFRRPRGTTLRNINAKHIERVAPLFRECGQFEVVRTIVLLFPSL